MWDLFTNFLKSSKQSINSDNNNNTSNINAKSVAAVGSGRVDYTDTCSEDSFHSAPNHLRGDNREEILPSPCRDGAPASIERWLDSVKVKVEPSPNYLRNPACHCMRVSKSKEKSRFQPYTTDKFNTSKKIKRENKSDRGKKTQNDFNEISKEERLLIQTDIVPYPHKRIRRPGHAIAKTAIREYLTLNPPPIKETRLILKNLRDTSLIQDRLTVEQEEFVRQLISRILYTLTVYMTHDGISFDRYFKKPYPLQIASVHLPAHYYGDLKRLDLGAPDIGHYELFKIIRYFDKITNLTAKRKSEQLLLKTGMQPNRPVIRLCDPSDPNCTKDIASLQKMELKKKQNFSWIQPPKILPEKTTKMKKDVSKEKYGSLENTASRPRYKSDKSAQLAKEIEEMSEKIKRKMDYLEQINSKKGKITALRKPTSHTSPSNVYHSTTPMITTVEPVEPLNLWRPRPSPTSTDVISQIERCSLIDIPSTTADVTSTTNTKPTSARRSNNPNIATVNCVPVPNTSATVPRLSHVPAHMWESKKSLTALCSIESSGGECSNSNCHFSHFRDFS